MDSICCPTSEVSVSQMDGLDWCEPIYLDGLSAVSKFIFPLVPSSISRSSVAGPRLSAAAAIAYWKR